MSNRKQIIEQINGVGQSVWIDSISRDMITSGELKSLVDEGVTGITSNPSIFDKAISGSTTYDEDIVRIARRGAGAVVVLTELMMDDISNAADELRGVYDATQGNDGYVSIEVNPEFAHDEARTVKEGLYLWERIAKPNLMIKVPGTEQGLLAVRELIERGVNVNVTLLFSVAVYERVIRAYIEGLKTRVEKGLAVDKIASVASFFVSRVDTAVDTLLAEGHELRGKAAIANARLAYQSCQRLFCSEEFDELRTKYKARVQRPLWASTSAKNPAYGATCYVDSLIGPNTVNTMPLQTFEALTEVQQVRDELSNTGDSAQAVIQELKKNSIDLEDVTDELLKQGIKAFADAYQSTIRSVESKIPPVPAV